MQTNNVHTAQTSTNPKEIVDAVRNRAQSSPVFNAMCNVFALRERTRQQITIPSLYQAMIKEGFKFNKKDYAQELDFLAGLHIGKLDYDKKGVRALKGIKYTLQSIGLAGASKTNRLDKVILSPVFSQLPAHDLNGVVVKPSDPPAIKSPPVAKTDDYKVTLTIRVDGKDLSFDLSALATKEILKLIASTYKAGKS